MTIKQSIKKAVKSCSKCGEFKKMDKFYRNRTNPDGRQYACIDCERSINDKKDKPNCLICGKEVSTPNNKLCSISCSNKWKYKNKNNHPMWKGGKIEVECDYCGKSEKKKKYKLKITKNLFCSQRCNGLYQAENMPTKETSIERYFEKALKENGIDYKKQYSLFDICIADFYIPSLNLALFVDGDYWHNLPKTIKKDRRQEKELENKDINFDRIWGSQIRELKDKGRLVKLIDHLADGGSIEDYFKQL